MQERHLDRKKYFAEQAGTTEKYVIPFIRETIDISEDTSVLEIGCGEGGNLLPFLNIGCNRIVGVDLAAGKIKNARDYSSGHPDKDKITFIHKDIYDLEEIGPLALQSGEKIDFSTGCAVFAESEAVSRIAEGARKEDILAAVHRAISAKVENLVERVGLKMDCAVIGGGAKDSGLTKSLEKRLGHPLIVPDEPRIMTAYGAALLALERLSSKGGS